MPSWLKRITRLGLAESGRLVSAAAMVLAALGLFELTRRREGIVVAYLAAAAFAILPLTIRYGRAFQPDAAMLGTVVLGLACWDRYCVTPRWYWLATAWLLTALAFSLKITAACLLLPLVLVIARKRPRRELLVIGSTLIPALVWYAWANHVVGTADGSRASADNRSIWLGSIGPAALLRPRLSLTSGGSCACARSPLLVRCWRSWDFVSAPRDGGSRDRLWLAWGCAAIVALALLAEKLHHEYYWLLVVTGCGRWNRSGSGLPGWMSSRRGCERVAGLARALMRFGSLDMAHAR